MELAKHVDDAETAWLTYRGTAQEKPAFLAGYRAAVFRPTPPEAPEAVSVDGVGSFADLQAAIAEVEQEWRWGNLTKLGVANHLRRRGLKLEAACQHAERIAALSPKQPVGRD